MRITDAELRNLVNGATSGSAVTGCRPPIARYLMQLWCGAEEKNKPMSVLPCGRARNRIPRKRSETLWMNRGTLPNYTFNNNECIASRNGENCQLSAGKLQCQRLPGDRSVVLMNCQFGGSRRLNVLRAYGRLSQHTERE